MELNLPRYSIVLIDEIESSLHPRAQRRLIRDLAEKCRQLELQVVLTTHSPYVLEELPVEARAYIMQVDAERKIVYGVSPEFAMTKMDDVQQPECDLYVEDTQAKILLTEILAAHAREALERCRLIPFGAAPVGRALGQMVAERRFPRPCLVLLDGDQAPAQGCVNLPGDDAPERVVFDALQAENWALLPQRVGRNTAEVIDACTRSMTKSDHHDWIIDAANRLHLGGEILWQAMCAEWVRICLASDDAKQIAQPIEDALNNIEAPRVPSQRATHQGPSAPRQQQTPPPAKQDPQSVQLPLLTRLHK